ncbi:MAG: Tic22 family protein, partial [Dolichospermum sp.]
WGVTLGIAGSVIFTGISAINNSQALALPQEQVVKRLQGIPVFTLTNPQGEFVVISTKNQSKTISQIGFFLSKKDAQKFLEVKLKKENPQLASNIQVRSISLAVYYNLVAESKKKKDSLIFTLVPTKQQVDSAKSILTSSSGKPVEQFHGIPLFVPKFKQGNNYLTIPISQNSERYIPFYFDKEQATAVLEAFKKAKPQEAANTEIEVVDLDGVINALHSSKDPNTSKIFLFPSRESIEFIRSLPPNQQNKK